MLLDPCVIPTFKLNFTSIIFENPILKPKVMKLVCNMNPKVIKQLKKGF